MCDKVESLGNRTFERERQDRLRPMATAGEDTNAKYAGSIGGRDIGWAVKQLWHGQKVTRSRWNGRGQYLQLSDPRFHNHSPDAPAFVLIRTVEGSRVPWTCSQTDLLATDWMLSEAE